MIESIVDFWIFHSARDSRSLITFVWWDSTPKPPTLLSTHMEIENENCANLIKRWERSGLKANRWTTQYAGAALKSTANWNEFHSLANMHFNKFSRKLSSNIAPCSQNGSISCGIIFNAGNTVADTNKKKRACQKLKLSKVFHLTFPLSRSFPFSSPHSSLLWERQHHPCDKWMKFCVTWHYEIDNVSLPHTLVHFSRFVSRWQTMSTRERENNITFPFSVNFHFCQLV